MNYRFLGYLTLALALIVTAPYWLRTLNSWTIKTKDKRFLNLIKQLRRVHKPLGIALGAIALWHGITALGSFRLHTGSVAFSAILITVVLGGAHYRLKNKRIFKAHKVMAFISVLLVVLHLLWPSAIWRIFGV